MKIKKKTIKQKAVSPAGGNERNIFSLVILIILLVDLLLMLAAFPAIDDMMATSLEPDSAERALMFKTTLVISIDVFLFVTLFMILSRRSSKKRKE